jgi:hypothetical protein
VLFELTLTNFRGFKRHVVAFTDLTVLIGKNNAGKSSVIEALRITSIAIQAFLTARRFEAAPQWALADGADRGLRLDASTVRIDLRTACHRYNAPPAVITCRFANSVTVNTFIGPDSQIHSCLLDPAGTPVTGSRDAKHIGLWSLSVLPQIGPLERTETLLNKAYIKQCLDGHLSSRHFRNQIRYNLGLYESFGRLVHESWPSISLDEFVSPDAIHGEELALFIREQGFVAEVSNFGHGLQMWLQIVWFLTRTNTENIVVLDEPDVYMHPSLQEKLVTLVSGKFSQCIISTHAPSIVAAVSNRSIVEVDRSKDRSECGIQS